MESLLSGTNLCGQKATICLLRSLVYLGPLHQNHSSVSTLLWTTVTHFFYKIDGLILLRFESQVRLLANVSKFTVSPKNETHVFLDGFNALVNKQGASLGINGALLDISQFV